MPAARRRQSKATHGPDWPQIFASLEAAAGTPLLKQFYAKGSVGGDTPLAEVPFVALDLETTGMNPDSSGIVSIGLVPFTLDRIRCAGSRYWVLRPRRPLSEASIAIHQITHEDLQRAPDLNDVLGDLLDALAGRVAVVHHRGVERPFLRRAVYERLGERLEFPVVDTMEIEARIHRGWKTSAAVRLLAGLIGRQPKSIRLAQSRDRYHLPLYRAHHALTDALASAELFQAQVSWRFSRDTPLREIWH
ncbi:MAG: 3'-5' exonuclease [Wenzhouxiangellaceae bacterium]